jgi:hypothetical protein
MQKAADNKVRPGPHPYASVAQEEEHESPQPMATGPSALPTPSFTKAAIVFHDQLQQVRHKRVSDSTVSEVSESPGPKDSKQSGVAVVSSIEVDGNDKLDTVEGTVLGRQIRLLRALQSALTALLSLSIAFFQGRAYVVFVQTKDVPGAWPTTPFIAPTLLLLSVAIAASVFDICLIVAYLFPGRKFALKAIRVATRAHWVVTTAKTASYALSSVVCRTGFDFGNTSNTNNDLWSWTCSAKADQFAEINQAESNCQIQVRSPFNIPISNLDVRSGINLRHLLPEPGVVLFPRQHCH